MRFCKSCGKTEEECRIVNHHISYEEQTIVELCDSCHFKVHRQKNNPLYPIDKPDGMDHRIIRKLLERNYQGRVTIPKVMVQMLGWNNGDDIEFRVDRDEIIMRKARA